MPGGDGTGPMGQGPMTGRRAGFCAGYSLPGYMNPIVGKGIGFGFGRGFGRGRGRGFGMGRGFGWKMAVSMANPYLYGGTSYPYMPEMSPKQEANMLRDQVKAMQEEMKELNEQISILEKPAAKEKK